MQLFSLLTTQPWEFINLDTPTRRDAIGFSRDGTVLLYDNPNERFWSIHEGRLRLHDVHRRVSVVFTECESTESGLVLRGKHLLVENAPTLCIKTAQEQEVAAANIARRVETGETRDHFAARIATSGWKIGAFTHGFPRVVGEQFGMLEIGRHCSIGGNVTIILAQHNYRFVTTAALALYVAQDGWTNIAPDFNDHVVKSVKIGSDVWISEYAQINSGVSIGHGAVIGAHAVVTKDVAPFAIVGGVPANLIKYRFPQPIIERLLRLAWWDWSWERVNEMTPLLLSEDVEAFLKANEP